MKTSLLLIIACVATTAFAGAAEDIVIKACIGLCEKEISFLPDTVCEKGCHVLVEAGIKEADAFCDNECKNLFQNPATCIKDCDAIFSVGVQQLPEINLKQLASAASEGILLKCQQQCDKL